MEGFDVSGLDTPWDDDEDQDSSSVSAARVQRRQTVCPSHERALPVNDIVHLLDMKEEGELAANNNMLFSNFLSSNDAHEIQQLTNHSNR